MIVFKKIADSDWISENPIVNKKPLDDIYSSLLSKNEESDTYKLKKINIIFYSNSSLNYITHNYILNGKEIKDIVYEV